MENDAFNEAKKLLMDSQTLVHYDDTLPLFLSCDASSYGAGAVLSHRIDGHDRPVAFASCTLTKPLCNYLQSDKEAFSIIFGLKKCHQFLYGRSLTFITDHKPLLELLGPHRPVPVHAAAQIQHRALILAAYNYSIESTLRLIWMQMECLTFLLHSFGIQCLPMRIVGSLNLRNWYP